MIRITAGQRIGWRGARIFPSEYFEDSPPSSLGLIKYWSGAAWLAKPIKYWNGSAWTQKPLKYWNGASWI